MKKIILTFTIFCLFAFSLLAFTKDDIVKENLYILMQLDLLEKEKSHMFADKIRIQRIIDQYYKRYDDNCKLLRDMENNEKNGNLNGGNTGKNDNSLIGDNSTGNSTSGNEWSSGDKLTESEKKALEEKIAAKKREKEILNNSIIRDVKECKNKQKKLLEKKKEYEKVMTNNDNPLSETENYNYQKMLDSIGNQIIQQQNEINKKIDELSACNKELSALTKIAEESGDPVDVTTGQYIAYYTDYVAQDFGNKFRIDRKYNKNNYGVNFGINWACTMDERIVRCVHDDLSNCISYTKEILETYTGIRRDCDRLFLEYDYFSDEINNSYVEAYNQQLKYQDELNQLLELDKLRNELIEKNKYVTYGPFEYPESYKGVENQLIFFDENGINHLFVYDDYGWWHETNGDYSLFSCLRGLEINGDYSNTIKCNGGYELIYKSGDRIIFDSYGIIKEKIDRNNNKTCFITENGLINKIILKTGEEIILNRNENNYITSICGDVSGTALFEYSGNRLTSAIDNEGIKVKYHYDEKNNLTEIVKADNSSVKINYEFNGNLYRDVCTSVINENNSKETFQYDYNNNVVYHDYYGEGQEYYNIGQDGNTKSYKDFRNNYKELVRDDKGQIITVRENGLTKQFIYNDSGKMQKIIFGDGSSEIFSYNSRNQITKVQDSDGFINTYEYDDFGNLIKSKLGNALCGEYFYYKNGLLKEYIENNVTYKLNYNNYGAVTEKVVVYPTGKEINYKWEYDDKNRLINYVSSAGDHFSYKYDNFKETIIGNGKEVIRIYNERGWLTTEIVKDSNTGDILEKRNEYDNVGNIIKVYVNNALVSEYEYFKNGILKSYIVWNNPKQKELLQGIKTQYEYNDRWEILSEYRSWIKNNSKGAQEPLLVKRYEYRKEGNNTVVTLSEKMKAKTRQIFNSKGKIIRFEDGTDYYKNYLYSAGGRLIQTSDSNQNLYKYYYSKDGGYKEVYECPTGISYTKFYNHKGDLIKISDNLGIQWTYDYDFAGNLIKEQGPNYISDIKYDDKNRILEHCIRDSKGKVLEEYNIEYDDNKHEKRLFVENGLVAYERVDVWDRIVEENNNTGHNFYKYDGLGNCYETVDIYGNSIRKDFSPLGELICINYENGESKNYEYDLMGNLLTIANKNKTIASYEYGDTYKKQKYLGSEQQIFYDENRNVEKIINYDTGQTVYEKTQNGINYIDNNHKIYGYELDNLGRVISEENPNGEKQHYKYDNFGFLSEIISCSGKSKKYEHDLLNNISTLKYEGGEIVEIKKNSLGNIVKIKSNDYLIEFEYDKKGNIISEYNGRTNTKIKYKYDNFNRCIEKSGANFCFMYFYDDMGKVSKVQDRDSGQWVGFEYDSNSRLSKKIYSNGCESKYSFNENGQIEYMVSKNQFGSIIHGDFLVYDDDLRVSLIADNYGNVKSYKYDKMGRLIETVYPYTKDKNDFYLSEATECGYFLEEQPVKSKNIIPQEETKLINSLYDKAGIGKFARVNNAQDYWKEEYKYNEDGNVISVKNPYGVIKYKYDDLKRVIFKNYDNTESEGINIKWDKDNCLEEYKSKKRIVSFEYKDINRPCKIINKNLETGNIEIVEYIYDGFGRRVLEKSNQKYIEYIYDGLSTYLIGKQYTTENDYVLTPIKNNNETIESIQLKESNNDTENYSANSPYRIVDNSKYAPYGSKKEDDKIENEKGRDERAYNILAVGGTAFMLIYNTGSNDVNSNVNFPITNYSNEIIGFVNKDGDLENKISYDTWGNIFGEGKSVVYTGAKNKESKFDFVFNLGYRDYFPLIKSFISEDPCRDGQNWFTYCSCDPVNYEDSYGLSKQAITESEKYLYDSVMVQSLKLNVFSEMRDNPYVDPAILKSLDCADSAAYAEFMACLYSGIPARKIPKEILRFGVNLLSGNLKEAKNCYSSEKVRKQQGARYDHLGYDRDFIKKNENNPNLEDEVNLEKTKRELFLDFLREPGNVTVGTIFALGNSKTPLETSAKECGHVITVLAVETDDNGIPVGFMCYEGHIGKKPELTFISIDPAPGCDTFDNYMGKITGVSEIENDNVFASRRGCGK